MAEKAPILILHGSKQPYLSIGCRFGGIKAYGHEYLYIPPRDAFLRKDWVKKLAAHNKKRGTWDEFVELVKSEQ